MAGRTIYIYWVCHMTTWFYSPDINDGTMVGEEGQGGRGATILSPDIVHPCRWDPILPHHFAVPTSLCAVEEKGMARQQPQDTVKNLGRFGAPRRKVTSNLRHWKEWWVSCSFLAAHSPTCTVDFDGLENSFRAFPFPSGSLFSSLSLEFLFWLHKYVTKIFPCSCFFFLW